MPRMPCASRGLRMPRMHRVSRTPRMPEVFQGLRVPSMPRVVREQQEGCGQKSPMGCPIPHPCGVGGVGQGGACPGQALQSLESRAAINWVFHSLPCQGRVEVGGRGQEVQKGLGEETSSMSHCS